MITDARANAILDTEFAASDKMSLHTAYSATGTNEVTGGSYTKQTITWAAASARSKASSGNIDFSVAAAVTVAWIGVWNSALTVFRGMWPNGGTDYSFQLDVATNNRIYAEGTGLVNDDRVTFTGATVPAGLTAGTHYYVVGATSADPDYFQVSATLAGAAIDITGLPSADARVSKIVLETYAGAGTHRVSSFSVGL